jgi:hypothetical protein
MESLFARDILRAVRGNWSRNFDACRKRDAGNERYITEVMDGLECKSKRRSDDDLIWAAGDDRGVWRGKGPMVGSRKL